MKKRELINFGIPKGALMKAAQRGCSKAARMKLDRRTIRAMLENVVLDPANHLHDPCFSELAIGLNRSESTTARYQARKEPAPYTIFGSGFDPKSIEQLQNACELPISVAAALMPDAHLGYGLPIGGVLATRNAVIPYAVGVDIACRMKLTVLDLPVSTITRNSDSLQKAITTETRFGVGSNFKKRRSHAVLDDDWTLTPHLRHIKDKAWAQLGSSGSGNHFVEFGILTIGQAELGLQPGDYLALMSHSGSRGPGAMTASKYCRLAQAAHPDLPRELHHLAWLDMDSEHGQEYWESMQLMGRYAAANHECIHRHIAKHLGAVVLADIENHHNFAWKEEHFGEDVIVHRKGATPAGEGVLGIIPGSMATPAFIVRGKGNAKSLRSAAHGAGRVMSRTKAKNTFRWPSVRKELDAKKVLLMSAGLDEVPGVYKNIHDVMAAQTALVGVLATFQPRIVKMAGRDERRRG